VVRLYLTDLGRQRLEALSELHLEELERLALELPAAWAGLAPVQRAHGFPGSPPRPEEAGPPPPDVVVARAYGLKRDGGYYVLVDRLWPRGLRREGAPFDQWLKEVAPSTELRKWYAHDPGRFGTFTRRYQDELKRPPASEAVGGLQARAKDARVVLVTATKDVEHSAAAVLQRYLTST
jgi:uncharacterized protein YeaO (DUF488 family)